MEPSDIYKAPICAKQTNLHSIEYFLEGVNTCDSGVECQDRVVVKTHFDPYIDGSRNATLYSVWYLGKPFMLCKTGGRPDREHFGRFITDESLFREAIAYLKSLETEYDEIEVFNPDEDVPELDVVYTYEITLEDLGRVAQSRQWLSRYFREWPRLDPWPYGVHTENGWVGGGLTLEQKKAIRWPRIKDAMEEHFALDPDAAGIAKIIREREEIPTDEMVAGWLETLLHLPPGKE